MMSLKLGLSLEIFMFTWLGMLLDALVALTLRMAVWLLLGVLLLMIFF